MKNPLKGLEARPFIISYAIVDGDRLLEEAHTGKLAIYYALEDAVAAFPAVKRGADKSMQAGLRICEVEISKPQQLPSPNIADQRRSPE